MVSVASQITETLRMIKLYGQLSYLKHTTMMVEFQETDISYNNGPTPL